MPPTMIEWLYFGFYTNQLVCMLGTIPYVKQNQNEFRNKTRMITLFSIVSTDILYIYGNKPCQADHGSFLGTSERKNKFVIVFHRIE